MQASLEQANSAVAAAAAAYGAEIAAKETEIDTRHSDLATKEVEINTLRSELAVLTMDVAQHKARCDALTVVLDRDKAPIGAAAVGPSSVGLGLAAETLGVMRLG